MGYRTYAQVIRVAAIAGHQLTAVEKAVLLNVAWHRREDANQSFLPAGRIADETALCRRSVLRALATLEKLGAFLRHGPRRSVQAFVWTLQPARTGDSESPSGDRESPGGWDGLSGDSESPDRDPQSPGRDRGSPDRDPESPDEGLGASGDSESPVLVTVSHQAGDSEFPTGDSESPQRGRGVREEEAEARKPPPPPPPDAWHRGQAPIRQLALVDLQRTCYVPAHEVDAWQDLLGREPHDDLRRAIAQCRRERSAKGLRKRPCLSDLCEYLVDLRAYRRHTAAAQAPA